MLHAYILSVLFVTLSSGVGGGAARRFDREQVGAESTRAEGGARVGGWRDHDLW